MSNEIDFSRLESDQLDEWTEIRTANKGERAVKAGGDTYLPRPNPQDTSDENETRYTQYKRRAVFYNATQRTLNGLIGIALRKPPELELPSRLDALETDTDGAGGKIYNQAHRTLEETLLVGRCGLLTDYPQTSGPVSVRDEQQMGLHPRITQYQAENIINWRLGADNRLSLVVLYEPQEVADGYGYDTQERYRELTLEPGYYVQRLWVKGENGVELEDEWVPLKSDGTLWNEIPFTFVGAVDNDSDIDLSPIGDLVKLNMAHYRCAADYFESAYFSGQPTHWASGLDRSWIEDVWQGREFFVGSRAVVPLPDGGAFGIAQAQPNTLASEAMDKLERQMVALGARLMMPGEAVKTAEQSRSETAAAHSVLSLATENVSAAYQQALMWAAEFSGDNPESVGFQISTDFTGLLVDPQTLLALVKGWQSGAYPQSDLWATLRQIGIIDPDKTDEELEEEIDSEGGGLSLEDMAVPEFDDASDQSDES